MNSPFCITTFDQVTFDTAIAQEEELVVEILTHLAINAETLAEKHSKESTAFYYPEIPIHQIMFSAYKWFVGSGRIIYFSSRVISAYKEEKANPHFNIEVSLAILTVELQQRISQHHRAVQRKRIVDRAARFRK